MKLPNRLLVLISISCLTTKTFVSSLDVSWSDPPSAFCGICGKVTGVFGVTVCATPTAFANDRSAVDHVVNVFFQLLDNDADGNADDATVLAQMVDNNYVLFIPDNEEEGEELYECNSGLLGSLGKTQTVFRDRVVTNSCDVPTNRGASATDRTTWSAVRDTSSLTSCSNNRDETTEEILHLITEAAAILYPNKWGTTFSSEAGAALSTANGNCGWGYTGNWIDPSSGSCTGQFAYEDETCDEACNVVEGIYWASLSYIGGLYTIDRTSSIANEWLMATPDDSMVVEPSGVGNAATLQSGSSALYALVSDTTSTENAWLPLIMPDGNYQGSATATTVTDPNCGSSEGFMSRLMKRAQKEIVGFMGFFGGS